MADAGNNRQMLWHCPDLNNMPCDVIVGQAGLHGVEHNQGSDHAGAARLNMPCSTKLTSDWLLVADSDTNHLMLWPLAGGAR